MNMKGRWSEWSAARRCRAKGLWRRAAKYVSFMAYNLCSLLQKTFVPRCTQAGLVLWAAVRGYLGLSSKDYLHYLGLSSKHYAAVHCGYLGLSSKHNILGTRGLFLGAPRKRPTVRHIAQKRARHWVLGRRDGVALK